MAVGKAAIILGVGLSDQISRDLDAISSKLRGKMRNLSSVGSSLTMGLTLPIVGAGAALIKFTGDLDAMKRALAANMGSAAAAGKEFEKLRELAKAPGIGFEEAIQGSYRLQGLGKDADEARHIMEGFAKAVSLSGGGNQEFGGIMTQVGQMFGKGRVLQQDLKFMVENAPIISKVMRDTFGTIDPQEIQKKGISVNAFIEGLVQGFGKLPAIGNSVKNSMENLWTSIKIGTGEIGLSILGVTNWGEVIENSADSVQRITTDVAEWISKHRLLTKAILEFMVLIAATGPIVKLIGNIGLLVSVVMDATTWMYALTKAFVVNTYASLKTTAGLGQWVKTLGIAGVAVAAQQVGVHFLSEAWDDLAKKMDKGALSAAERAEAAANAFNAVMLAQFGQAYKFAEAAITGGDYEAPTGGHPGRGSLGGDRYQYNLARLHAKNPAITPEGDDEWKKLMEEERERKIKLQRDMRENWGKMKMPMILDTYKTPKLDVGGIKDIQPSGGRGAYLEQSDVTIMDQYYASLRQINQETILGAKPLDVMKMNVDALRIAYEASAKQFGSSSSEAVTWLEQWKQATTALTDEQKKQIEEQEKLQKTLQVGMAIMNGVADAVSGLFAGGEEGTKNFVVAVLKAVSAVMKLAIATFVAKSIEDLGFFGAIPAIVGGGLLLGAMEGLMNKISAAKGGIITGPTLLRAGEYPGAGGANPEVIQPLSKLKQLLGDMGGGNVVQVVGVLRGDDIHLQTSKAQTRAMRRGSGNVITF